MTPHEKLLAALGASPRSQATSAPWVMQDPRWNVQLSDEEKHLVTSICPPRLFERGEHMFRQGDVADRIHILVRGYVKLYTEEQSAEGVLHLLSSGDVFGESFLTDTPCYLANAVCVSDSAVVCAITEEKFLELAMSVPRAVLAFASVLAQYNVDLQRRLRDMSRPALERVACTMIDLAKRCGTLNPDGTYRLRLPLKHAEIASLANTTRVTATQCIGQLRDMELVTGGRGVYRVEVAGLEALAARLEGQEKPAAGK